MSALPEIYLTPTCARCKGRERTWCKDQVNGCDGPDGCGRPPLRYVLAAEQLPMPAPDEDDD